MELFRTPVPMLASCSLDNADTKPLEWGACDLCPRAAFMSLSLESAYRSHWTRGSRAIPLPAEATNKQLMYFQGSVMDVIDD